MSDEVVISRDEAKIAGLKYYYTGIECKRGHKSKRLTSSGSCNQCERDRYAMNSEKYKEKSAKRYYEKREEILKQYKKYREKNRDNMRIYMRNYVRERCMRDAEFRTKHIMRTILWRAATHYKGGTWSMRTSEALGYTAQDLRGHISKLLKNGMTWENYGKWHIDHRRPLSSFDLSTIEGIRLANSLHNLQPMWAKKNIKKRDAWNGQLTIV